LKLNHLHLTVDDVPAARAFLERYFGLRPAGAGHKNFDMLRDDDGFVLTLMGVGKGNSVSYPDSFHLGFIQPSAEAVDGIYEELRADGFEVEAPRQQHGAHAFRILAPGNFGLVVRA
jgi:catechol 2,3-dioxygenase-like lactoylglutathione lyase family enzyme